MPTFYKVLVSALIASATNNFVWFALTYWAYLETKSVVATSIVGGTYLVAAALSSFWFGSLVDHHKKKHVMLFSSITTLVFFLLGFLFYIINPASAFQSVTNIQFWIIMILLLCGTVVGNIYGIVVPTLVTVLVPEERHDKANGMFGTVMGISFAITSVGSGFMLGFFGMFSVLFTAIILTLFAVLSVSFLSIPEKDVIHVHTEQPKKIDLKGTITVIGAIPGLFGLIFFNMINNFLGGVFMALMDAYGLTLVNVQTWGLLWGFLSFSFIAGGLLVAKFGLGKNPLRMIMLSNVVMWTSCIFFTIQPSIWLLVGGVIIWMTLMPFIEAAEQTVIQKVVPQERQGRVFGFAQSIEQTASPLTAFLIGPIAQFIFIPFMTTGKGVELIGSWFGTGTGRGIALVFIVTGIIGLIITLLAMHSKPYKLLSKRYLE